MSCKRFGAAIAAHAGGADVDRAAARHISGCAACRERLERQRRLLAELDAELGRTLSISASPGFVARAATAARQAKSAPSRRWVPAPVWTAVGVAAAIVMAVWIRQPGVVDSSHASDFRLKAEATVPASPRSSVAAPPRSFDPAPPRSSVPAPPRSSDPAFPRSRVSASPRSRVPAASPDPPVIVEPSRALAIQRLRELNGDGRLDGAVLPLAVTSETAFADLTIPPLQVAAIEVTDVEIVSRSPAVPSERQ